MHENESENTPYFSFSNVKLGDQIVLEREEPLEN
jgi:hypothetical protein